MATAERGTVPAATAAHPLLAAGGLLVNALVWGLSWWPFRQLQAQGLHPLWLTALMFCITVAGLTLVRPAAWAALCANRGLWLLLLAAGATNACFNWAVSIGDVVRVVLLFYLMPLWAVLLARLLLDERISAAGALRVALALAGAVVVLWPVGEGAAASATGHTGVTGAASLTLAGLGLPDLLAIAGGFFFALNNVMLRREAASPESARALAMFAGGALVSLLLAAALGQVGLVPAPPAPQWGWVAGALALTGVFLLSNLALQYGAARLPANTTSVIMVTELAFASVSSVLAGAGTLNARLLLGGGMILSATLLAALRRD